MAHSAPKMSQDLSDGNFANRVEDNKLYKLKKTGASADDIVHVWNYVSAYIRDQMQKNKGVNISGLGQFTFTHRKTDVGNNKYILVQRPVFILSEKFAQKHQLASTKHHLTGQIAVSDLNFASIAFDTPFSRDMVEECVRDVILEFSRALSAGRNIEFSFTTVGRLTIRGGKVKMRFYKDFINSLEFPEEILNAMRDRKSQPLPGALGKRCIHRSMEGRGSRVILPTLDELQVHAGSLKLQSPLPTLKSPPKFKERLSPYCHGLPRIPVNPRERRMLDSPSDEQKELLKERDMYKDLLDTLSIRSAA